MFPIMVVSSNGKRHTIPVSGWTHQAVEAVALSYEASGYQVATGFGPAL